MEVQTSNNVSFLEFRKFPGILHRNFSGSQYSELHNAIIFKSEKHRKNGFDKIKPDDSTSQPPREDPCN